MAVLFGGKRPRPAFDLGNNRDSGHTLQEVVLLRLERFKIMFPSHLGGSSNLTDQPTASFLFFYIGNCKDPVG